MRRLVIALLLVALPSTHSHAALRINFDPGGRLGEYIERFTMLRDAEAKVILDGMCISACTLMTGILNDEQVCVTSRARLAFHSARTGDGEHSSEGTRLAWAIYPEKVRALLRGKGWNGDDPQTNAHPELIYIEGAELRTIYHDCPTA